MEQTERIFMYKVKEGALKEYYEEAIKNVVEKLTKDKIAEGVYNVPLEDGTFTYTYVIMGELGHIEGIEDNLEYATIREDGEEYDVLHKLVHYGEGLDTLKKIYLD